VDFERPATVSITRQSSDGAEIDMSKSARVTNIKYSNSMNTSFGFAHIYASICCLLCAESKQADML
jgi:hypothetical protein